MRDKGKMTIGLIQHSCSQDKELNLDKVVSMIKKVAVKEVQGICTQELFCNT
jgi:predicted amidohydrolase